MQIVFFKQPNVISYSKLHNKRLINDIYVFEIFFSKIDRIIPVSGQDEMANFNHLYETSSSRNLRDGHLWLSVFLRPPRSRFTRVQRLSSCLALLYLSMLVNIMWYGTVPSTPGSGLKIGPFSLSPAQVSNYK